jgi:hypothetical protein
MTTAKRKSPVRIVCPHCQRSYVIHVDLQRIFRTSPRAICARCGKRFDVIQRMSEIDESDTTGDVTDRRLDEPGPLGRVEHVTPARDRPAGERPKQPRAASEPKNGEAGEHDGAREEPAGRGDDALPPLPMLAAADRGAEPALPPERRKQAPPLPVPVQLAPAAAAPRSSLLPSSAAGDLGPPTASDLERPLPWTDPPATCLELEERALPESAEALEWLLTSVEVSRKAG